MNTDQLCFDAHKRQGNKEWLLGITLNQTIPALLGIAWVTHLSFAGGAPSHMGDVPKVRVAGTTHEVRQLINDLITTNVSDESVAEDLRTQADNWALPTPG